MRRGTARAVAAGSVAAVVVAGLVGVAALRGSGGSAKAASPFHSGSSGIGEPYFPLQGNGGYDVEHYDLALTYDPAHRALSGTATITATATESLSRFDLDLSGLEVQSVTVDRAKATWDRAGQELRITPGRALRRGAAFTVAVTYRGTPQTIRRSPIVFGSDYGWQYTSDGAFVGDEPNGASTWFPSNDHPSDKATYTFHIGVPAGLAVVSNGELQSQTSTAGRTTYVWDETKPMATYLATVGIGHWTFVKGRTAGGIPRFAAYDPALDAPVKRLGIVDLTERVTDYFATVFGPYPFTSTGAIVDNLPQVGFSLETQTRPLYGFAADAVTVSHELAHQWFGDSVSVESWADIWLNEGFATFASDLWTEHTGGPTTIAAAEGTWDRIPASDPFWQQAIAAPGPTGMFSRAVYFRGAMTLSALRKQVGDDAFFRILRTWATQHQYGNADTAMFEQLAEKVSGQDLDAFFTTWLMTPSKPATFG